MAEVCCKSITVSEETRGNLLSYTLSHLAASLDANGLWLGLPKETLSLTQVTYSTPLETIRNWLPASMQEKLSQTTECFCGEGIGVQASQIGGQVFPDLQPGPFWFLAPVPLESWTNGVLLITRDRPIDPDELDDSFYNTIILVASLLEQSLYKQAVSQYHCNMETLHTVSLRMASTLDLQEVLDLLAQSTLEILQADTTHIFIRSGDPDSPQPYSLGADAWRDLSAKPSTNISTPYQLIKLVAERPWPLAIEDIRQHPLSAEMAFCGNQSGSLLVYPLTRHGHMEGAFFVHFFQPHTSTPEERYMFSLLTDLALASIENARTAQAMNYQLAELAALQHLAQKITITLEQEEVLKIIVQALQSLLNASAVSIMLVDENLVLQRAATVGDETSLPDPAVLNPGEGFNGRVALSAKPFYLPNVGSEEHASNFPPHLHSLYLFPLKLHNRVAGVLSVTSATPNAFGPEAERIIAIASAQAAISLENSRLFHAEHRRATELKTLIDLNHLITQHRDLDSIFDAAYHSVSQLMKAEAFVISIRDSQTSEVVLNYVLDKGIRYPALRRVSGNGLSEYVINTKNIVLIDDIELQEIPFERIRFGSTDPVRSILAFPLLAGNQAIGMVSAQSYQAAAYSEHDLNLLQTIANAIATAIENSQLYAQLEERYQRLQESENKRQEFIQDISHELRNPLTFLKAYIDLLLAGEMGELNEKQYQALSVVGDKTNTLARLVNEIATLQTDAIHLLRIETIDLIRIVRNAILLAQETAHEHNIRIVLDVPEAIPEIHADSDRIAQVVDNLLSNAIKFGYPNSQIILHLEKRSDDALVSVFNQGEPIPEADQKKLFERFFQSSHRKEGLGLGLAIVRHIIEAHGGKVWFESESNKGTTFFFTLPYKQQVKERKA
jgi:signal transduction histidine kinase